MANAHHHFLKKFIAVVCAAPTTEGITAPIVRDASCCIAPCWEVLGAICPAAIAC